MKKNYLIVLSTLFFISNIVFSQDVEIRANNIDYAGQTITLDSDQNIINKEFHVKNIGTDTVFYWARSIVSSHPDFDIQLCDEMICYTTTGPFWIGPIKTLQNGDSLLYKPQITANGAAGSAEVKYFVLDEYKNKVDSLTVIFTSTLSTFENKKQEFNIFPNPAQNTINIKGESLKNGGTIVFLDALGKEVKRTLVNNVENNISISELKRGVYFVNIYSQDGVKSKVQRLVVQ